jgi:hypothetical protein
MNRIMPGGRPSIGAGRYRIAACGSLILICSLGAAPAGAQQMDVSASEALDKIGMHLQQQALSRKPHPRPAPEHRESTPLPQWVNKLHFDQRLLPDHAVETE